MLFAQFHYLHRSTASVLKLSLLAYIRSHREASQTPVDHFPPAYTAAVMNRDPGCTTKRIADDIVNCHIGGETGAVIYIGCLAIWRVRPRYIMMVRAQSNQVWTACFLLPGNCFIKRFLRFFIRPADICIKNAARAEPTTNLFCFAAFIQLNVIGS